MSLKYTEEFHSKWGFGDGDNVPDDAYAYRRVYVDLFNAMAVQMKSPVRCVAFNRGGVHNSCLVLYAAKQVIWGVLKMTDSVCSDAELLDARLEGAGEPDIEWIDDDHPLVTAVRERVEAEEDLDCFVWTETTVDEAELEETVKRIKKGKKR